MSKGITYKIGLDVSTTSSSKQVYKELEKSLKDSEGSLESLSATYQEMSKFGIKADTQFRKVLYDQIRANDKKLQQLDEEKVKITANKNLTEAEKVAQIQALKVESDKIKLRNKELSLQAKFNKATGKIAKTDDKLFKLYKLKVSAQERLNKLLGDENSLQRKVLKNSIQIAKQVGKRAVQAGGGLVLGTMAAGIAAADGLAEKEKALRALKGGVDPAVVDQVYKVTGADWGTIVAALNKLINITKDKELLVEGAALEIEYPGSGQSILSNDKVDARKDISTLKTAARQIQEQTGIQDLSGAMEAANKANIVSSGRLSRAQYLQAYAQLSQLGLDDEKINAVIRDVASKGEDFIETWNSADLSKYVWNKQMKNQIKNSDMSLSKIDEDKVYEKSASEKVAEKVREFSLKKDELLIKIMPLISEVLEKLAPVIGKLLDAFMPLIEKVLPAVAKGIDFLVSVVESILSILREIPWIGDTEIADNNDETRKLLKEILIRERDNQDIESRVETEKKVEELLSQLSKADSIEASKNLLEATKNLASAQGLPQKAYGGLVNSPVIAGEAGPELILPMNNPNRANQLINQYFTTNNNFSLNGPANALSLSQQLSTNRFARTAALW